MRNLFKYLKSQKLFWFAFIVLAGFGFSWSQVTSKPYISPGDPGCTTLDAYLATNPSNVTILISDHQTLDAFTDRAVPATYTLKVVKPGYITIPTGRTLAINGGLEAGDYQIFSCAGTGKVLFGPLLSARSGAGVGISEYKLRWWGAVGDGSTDDTAACQAAINVAYMEGGNYQPHNAVIVGTPYDVYATTGLTCSDSTGNYPGQLIIDGKGCTFKKTGITADPVFNLAQSGVRAKLQNMTIVGSCDYVFYHELASQPGNVRFQDWSNNWHNGVAVADQTQCKAAYNYYWEAGYSLTSQTLTVVKAAQTLARTVAGDFVADGIRVGDLITTAGFSDSDNNGIFRVRTVAANLITVDLTFGGPVLKDKTGNASTSIVKSGRLHVYGGGGGSAFVPSVPTPTTGETTSAYKAVEAPTNTPITTWRYSLYGSAIYNYCTGVITVDNVSIKNFDRGIVLAGSEWNRVTNVDIQNINCACYSVSIGSVALLNEWNHISTRQCYGDNPAYPYNFWLQDEDAVLTNIDLEMTRAGAVYSTGPGFTLTGFYCEGTCYQNNPTCTDFFFFDGASGVKVNGSTLAMGRTDSVYATSVNHLFRFRNCAGVTIANNWIYTDAFVYSLETSTGVAFRENKVDLAGSATVSGIADGLPSAVWENNTMAGAGVVIQPSMVRLSTLGVTEYSTLAAWMAYFSSSATTPLVPYIHTNVSYAKDTGAGFTDTNSLKLTFTNATNDCQFLGIGTAPASGTWTKLIIFAVKSDTALTLLANFATYVPLLGDNLWRVVYVVSDPEVQTGADINADFSSNVGGGANIWIDDYTVKYFPTKQEAVAYIGYWDAGH